MKKLKLLSKIVIYIIMATQIISAAVLVWLMRTWVQLSYAELIFHVKSSITGTNKDMVVSALVKYAFPSVLLIVAIIVINELLRKKYKRYIFVVITFLILLIGDYCVFKEFNVRTHIISDLYSAIFKLNESNFIEDNYVSTADTQIEFPNNKRNLIYIYLESAEISCADTDSGGAFKQNVIPNLTNISFNNENFSGTNNILDGAITLPGTDWTMGGMFAQSTGIPLKIALGGNTFGDESNSEFFPNIRAIGDILEDNGYKNVLLLGSDASFGGRKLFFKTHGNYDIHDFYYAKEQKWISQDYYTFWGYEDHKLFEFAKKEIQELAQSKQPFNYTMLTVDTHFEDGYVCEYCKEEFGDNQYANVFACSDRQVSEFVNWIMNQDFYDNTTIVLCGDHITMDSDFYDNIDSDYQRKTYSCIINGVATKKFDAYREYATIDMFPTTLAALGATLSSDKLGIGTNLYSDSKTIVEEYGVSDCMSELQKSSPFIENMAGLKIDEEVLSRLKDTIYLETANEAGNIRFRVFKLSNYIKYDSVKGLLLSVKNKKTNEEYLYNMELVKDDTNEDYYGVVHSDISFTDLQDLECELYLSAGDYDNYEVQKFTPDMFEEWDIRWD